MKHLPKGPPRYDRRKITKRKFLCSNVQILKLLSKKISGLSMISEIGKLRARKKIHYTSRGAVSKIMMFSVQTLEKRLRSGQPFFNRLAYKVCPGSG